MVPCAQDVPEDTVYKSESIVQGGVGIVFVKVSQFPQLLHGFRSRRNSGQSSIVTGCGLNLMSQGLCAVHRFQRLSDIRGL